MAETVVKFGTDGWRGIIADDFTYENVRVAHCSRDCALRDRTGRRDGRCVHIGYDTQVRVAIVLREWWRRCCRPRGFRVFLANKFTPTPELSVRGARAQGRGRRVMIYVRATIPRSGTA